MRQVSVGKFEIQKQSPKLSETDKCRSARYMERKFAHLTPGRSVKQWTEREAEWYQGALSDILKEGKKLD
jgi:hypothetical protein